MKLNRLITSSSESYVETKLLQLTVKMISLIFYFGKKKATLKVAF